MSQVLLKDFTLHPLVPADVQAFIELGTATCADMYGREAIPFNGIRRNFAQFVQERAFERDSEIYLVKNTEDIVVAQLWLHCTTNLFNSTKEIWIWDITVHEEFRRCGIGSALLQFAKNRAKEKGCVELWLLVSSKNDKAVKIYQAAGLTDRGILMACEIPPSD